MFGEPFDKIVIISPYSKKTKNKNIFKKKKEKNQKSLKKINNSYFHLNFETKMIETLKNIGM